MKVIKYKLKIILLSIILFINIYVFFITKKYFWKLYKINATERNDSDKIKNIIKIKGIKYLEKCLKHTLIFFTII